MHLSYMASKVLSRTGCFSANVLHQYSLSWGKSRNRYSEEKLSTETQVCTSKGNEAWEYISLLLTECVSFVKCRMTWGKEKKIKISKIAL